MKPVKYEIDELNEVFIEYRGNNRWAVVQNSNVLDKDANWYIEPFPSSRTEEYLNNTRFNSAEEAKEFFDSIGGTASLPFSREKIK